MRGWRGRIRQGVKQLASSARFGQQQRRRRGLDKGPQGHGVHSLAHAWGGRACQEQEQEQERPWDLPVCMEVSGMAPR